MKTIAIIGGGITGVYVAYFLSQHGFKTKVLDDEEAAGKATNVNPGGLNPLHGPGIPGAASAFAMSSFRLHLDNWQRISELSKINFHPRFVSRIGLAFTEGDKFRYEKTARQYESAPGFSSQWLDAAELCQRAVQANPLAYGGLLMSGNACVDSRQYLKAIQRATLEQGVEYIKKRATGLRTQGGSITAISTDSGEIQCDEVIFACGAWVDGPAEWLGVSIPVVPIKGELLQLHLPGFEMSSDIIWRQSGLYHKSGNEYWAGGTQDDVGFDASPTAEGRDSILSSLSHMLPGLKTMQVLDHQAGLRPMTPDGMPIADKVKGWENAYLVTGSGVKGILLSAGLGKVTAEMLRKNAGIKELDASLAFLSLERF